MKQNLMAIDLKSINKSFTPIFIKKNILICDLFAKIWKSDIFIPKLGSRTFFVFLELSVQYEHLQERVVQDTN